MKIKKNTFSTLVLELFFPSIEEIENPNKKQKSTSPTVQSRQPTVPHGDAWPQARPTPGT
jgi:hypothetical protein